MKKKIRFPTISIGSEPDQPVIEELAGFIGSHKGTDVDLITFYLARSLMAQKEAGISSPCGGGIFCLPRFESAITCTRESCYRDSAEVIADAEMMTRTAGPVRAAVPAPHRASGSPDPEDEDVYAAYCDEFAGIFREMRDSGIIGHLVHAQEVSPLEIERLASKKTSFIAPEGDEQVQGRLLEFQHMLTIHNSRLNLLSGLFDQYEIREIIIIDPDETGLRTAMEFVDQDQIRAGGYGTGQENEYWKNISGKAVVTIETG